MAIIPKGSEPRNVKARMDLLFSKLDEAYPDKVIRKLGADHKKWAETGLELARLLGYADRDAFLEAYGYTLEHGHAGRPKTDNLAVVEELKRRYPQGSGFTSIQDLEKENPDLKAKLKTLQNIANERLGMRASEYFVSIGLLEKREHEKELEEIFAVLKVRYPAGAKRPGTVKQLKEENPDLMMHRLNYIKTVYGANVKEYLQQLGILEPDEPDVPRFVVAPDDYEGCLRRLKQRYRYNPLQGKIRELVNENPDLPIRKLNQHLRENGETKVERYYIRNGILQGKETDLKQYIYCGVTYGRSKKYDGSKIYYYQTNADIYEVGDLVYVEDMCDSKRTAVVREIIHCLGIDAPWPVSQTLRMMGKVKKLAMEEEAESRQAKPEVSQAVAADARIFCDPKDSDAYIQAKRKLMKFADQLNENDIWGDLQSEPVTWSSYIPVDRMLTMKLRIVEKDSDGWERGEKPAPGAELYSTLEDGICIRDSDGRKLGELPKEASKVLVPMLRAGYAVIESLKVYDGCTQESPLDVLLEVRLAVVRGEQGSVVALRYENREIDTKELTLMRTKIPFSAADVIFAMGESWDGQGDFGAFCDACFAEAREDCREAKPYLEELKRLGIRGLMEAYTIDEEYYDFERDAVMCVETWSRLKRHAGVDNDESSIHLFGKLPEERETLVPDIVHSIKL